MELAIARISHEEDGGEAALLLREFAHRALNDVAVAAAAVSIAERRLATGDPAAALREARARLEGVGRTMRLLADPARGDVDLGERLSDVAAGVVAARAGGDRVETRLDLCPARVDAATARRVSLVAAELVGTACRHAFAGRGGVLDVRLRRAGGELVLEVGDDGGGRAAAATAGTGWGGGIVAELARRGGGSVALERGGKGAVATLRLPARPAPGRDRG